MLLSTAQPRLQVILTIAYFFGFSSLVFALGFAIIVLENIKEPLSMVSQELTPLEKFKLTVLSIDDFKDEEIEDMFLGFEVMNEDEILEIIGIVQEHRPHLIEKLNHMILYEAA